MARPSRTGVRGLLKKVIYFDGDGVKLKKKDALERIKRGERITKEERYHIDHRWRDAKTGKPMRHQERLADGINAATAKKRALDVINGASAGTLDKHAEAPKKVAEALTEYESWAKVNRPQSFRGKKSLCKILKDKLGHHQLEELAPFDVERFKRDREKDKAGPATINRAVSQLKHVYTMAESWGWVSTVARMRIHGVPKMKEPPGRVRCLSEDEEGKLFAQLKGVPLLIVTAADLTGMRRSEFVLLRKDAVDLARGTLTLRKTKSNRVRELSISAPLAKVLRDALATSPEDSAYVFTQQKGKNKGKPYTPGAITQNFRRAIDEAGITDLRLHDIRHDTATKMRRSGVGIDVISKVLGHSNISTTMRYAHVENALVKAAMDSVPAPIALPLPEQPKKKRSDEKTEPRKSPVLAVR